MKMGTSKPQANGKRRAKKIEFFDGAKKNRLDRQENSDKAAGESLD